MDSVPHSPPARRRLSRRKRLLFASLIGIGLLGFVELCCYIGLSLLTRFTLAQVYEARHEPPLVDPGSTQHEVPHPYLGWVLNPDNSQPIRYEGRTYRINDFGLMDNQEPLQKRGAGKVIVAVIGGSVAWQATVGGNEALLQELQRQPRFHGQQIVLVRLAMNAYKQPQQLLLATYLLSLGAEWDILINIDGYNETALHPAENGRHQVFHAFPRAWKARNAVLTDPRNLELLARLSRNRRRRSAWTEFCKQLPLQRSATVNFVWKVREDWLYGSIQRDLATLIESNVDHPGYQVTGPSRTYSSDTAMTEDLVNYWASCSRELQRLCESHQIEYHHVLPPNQHLLGSKPMSPAEEARALKKTPYSEGAIRAYPQLVRKGAELRQSGLRFHDLTGLFKNRAEPLYTDDCCHYNSTGSELLGREIARRVGAQSQ